MLQIDAALPILVKLRGVLLPEAIVLLPTTEATPKTATASPAVSFLMAKAAGVTTLATSVKPVEAHATRAPKAAVAATVVAAAAETATVTSATAQTNGFRVVDRATYSGRPVLPRTFVARGSALLISAQISTSGHNFRTQSWHEPFQCLKLRVLAVDKLAPGTEAANAGRKLVFADGCFIPWVLRA